MQDTLLHKWQSAICVISEILDETKSVVEQCSIGTLNDNARLDSIQEQWATDRISTQINLLDPESYRNEVLKDAEEFTNDKAIQEQVMRAMFRSVWTTVRNIRTLSEDFIDNSNLSSLRNIFTIQRDLVDKIIDMPFIHCNNKGRQYLEYQIYVSGPQKMCDIVRKMIPEMIQSEDNRMEAVLNGIKGLFNTSMAYHIKENDIKSAVRVYQDCAKISEDFTTLGETLDTIQDPLGDEMHALKDKVHATIEEMMYRGIHHSIAIYVAKYYSHWGDWLDLSPEIQDKKIRGSSLGAWISKNKWDHAAKLDHGLLPNIDKNFYKFESINFSTSEVRRQCSRLPRTYHLHSLYAHDSFANSIYIEEQEWVESVEECQSWPVLGFSILSLYVAASHFYNCAELDEKCIERLRQIIRENPIENIPLFL